MLVDYFKNWEDAYPIRKNSRGGGQLYYFFNTNVVRFKICLQTKGEHFKNLVHCVTVNFEVCAVSYCTLMHYISDQAEALSGPRD